MRVLFDDIVPVHYGFLAVEPEGPTGAHLIESRGGQRNGLCGAAVPGLLSMVTGMHTGQVPLRVELLEAAPPPLGDEWEDVVEVSFEPAEALYRLTAFDFGVPLDVTDLGPCRARWGATGMDAAHAHEMPEDGGPAPDRYLLQLWPAPTARDEVVRQTSAHAAYWHSVAAATPPPPPPLPPPTERELAEERARARRADLARREALHWGGRPPTDELRGWGQPAAQLAYQDRALLDQLATLTPAQQRAVAVWAARRACERAGLMDHPLVVDAFRRVPSGEPVPGIWREWSSAWDAIYPPVAGDVVETSLAVHLGPADVRQAAPEMAAIGALMALGDPHPGRAAAGAVDALGQGVSDVRGCLAEVRAALARLTDGP